MCINYLLGSIYSNVILFEMIYLVFCGYWSSNKQLNIISSCWLEKKNYISTIYCILNENFIRTKKWYFARKIFFFVNPQTIKFLTSRLTLLHNRSSISNSFFRILSKITGKFGHRLLQLVTNISKSSLSLSWRLETYIRLLEDFGRIAV